MMRSMYSGVSGLKTHQTKMDVIGNNIANVNTVGFKSSSVTFSEIMYQNLSSYRIFYTVANTKNISKAAKELYISQPAISKAISKLEDSLSTVLFTRNSRGVQLTEEGQILFEHTSSAFEQLNAGELELKRVREFNMGQIRIGVSNTLCRFIMVSYLKNFIEQYPHIKISIDSQSTTHTLDMLEQQKSTAQTQRLEQPEASGATEQDAPEQEESS